ncbi:hypothetical protein HELRODRAFT_178992 [Helobdella robusta]|uniref:Uncharacterized protein n=1 Tax=Helobdella robusta TaxID=6412 RepID=T1FE08_HELRO|nr:hypothetical protein HELRODRAFT_178992 [Helobdella robusta]ESN95809.1 hypothetical protein HELRODRAFT_178992 [Helobdella robusta]
MGWIRGEIDSLPNHGPLQITGLSKSRASPNHGPLQITGSSKSRALIRRQVMCDSASAHSATAIKRINKMTKLENVVNIFQKLKMPEFCMLSQLMLMSYVNQ